mgnify:CR=1 FL=1
MEEALYSIYSDDPTEIFYDSIDEDFKGWVGSALDKEIVDKSWDFTNTIYFYLIDMISERLGVAIDDLEYEILQKFGTLETFVYESLNWLESEWNLVDNNQLAFNFKMFFGEGKEINI